MNELSTNVERLTELTPNGTRLRYLLSEGRVYATAESWARALNLPEAMNTWFVNGLSNKAMFKKNSTGQDYELLYEGKTVYRWHVVAEQLRAFDREWHNNQYAKRPLEERKAFQRFYENYEALVNWGWDLQEKAISSSLNLQKTQSQSKTLTQEDLLKAVKEAIAPRIYEHDKKLSEHDSVIAEIREVVPTLRNQDEFITIKQAIYEQGRDPNCMPHHPKSKETLSGITGQFLTMKNVEKGNPVASRLEGNTIVTGLNTYKRGDIYNALDEITKIKQINLDL